MTPQDIHILVQVFAASILFVLGAVAYRIATSCRHSWTVKDTVTLVSTYKSEIPVGHKIILQCSKCGSIKVTEV